MQRWFIFGNRCYLWMSRLLLPLRDSNLFPWVMVYSGSNFKVNLLRAYCIFIVIFILHAVSKIYDRYQNYISIKFYKVFSTNLNLTRQKPNKRTDTIQNRGKICLSTWRVRMSAIEQVHRSTLPPHWERCLLAVLINWRQQKWGTSQKMQEGNCRPAQSCAWHGAIWLQSTRFFALDVVKNSNAWKLAYYRSRNLLFTNSMVFFELSWNEAQIRPKQRSLSAWFYAKPVFQVLI